MTEHKGDICMLGLGFEPFFDTTEQVNEQFYQATGEAWNNLGNDCFNLLKRSMESLVDAVLEAVYIQ